MLGLEVSIRSNDTATQVTFLNKTAYKSPSSLKSGLPNPGVAPHPHQLVTPTPKGHAKWLYCSSAWLPTSHARTHVPTQNGTRPHTATRVRPWLMLQSSSLCGQRSCEKHLYWPWPRDSVNFPTLAPRPMSTGGEPQHHGGHQMKEDSAVTKQGNPILKDQRSGGAEGERGLTVPPPLTLAS